jgi:hypothetical protein
MKIGCFISQFTLEGGSLVVGDATKYDSLAKCAVDSFKKFHPEIELHYINDTNFIKYYEKYFQSYELVDHIGIVRYMLAYDIMLKENYDKLIVLGCDTITCSRLDEFINSTEDVLATLNYPCQESTILKITKYIMFALGRGNISKTFKNYLLKSMKIYYTNR